MIGGVVTMFSGDFFYGLVTIVGGVLFGRIWCELLIVLFKMNEALQVVEKRVADFEPGQAPRLILTPFLLSLPA